jgi:hypothetical protein
MTGRTLADVGGGTPSRRLQRFEEITVWLDRDEPPWPLDHLILERFARSLHAVKKSHDISPVAAALRTVCDPTVLPADRDNALRRLGVGPEVTVVVTHIADARRMPPGLVIDEHQINIFPAAMAPDTIPFGIAAGIHTCNGAEVPREWQHARTALRIAVELTTGEPTHVRYDQLGCIATIVESVDAYAAAQAPDVRRVSELQAQRPWVVATIEALLSHNSIREVARLQNLHHSTMRQRIDWLERKLGYLPFSSGGYARASTTLTLWRIAMAAQHRQSADPPATAV